MLDLKLILKGMLIGLGKIIPGVSGSLIAVSLGIYTFAIEAISHPFKNFKCNIIFLGNLCFGVLLSVWLCSGIICFLLDRYFFLTVLLFVGFIVGTFPVLFKDANISSSRDLIIVIIVIFVILLFSNFKSTNVFIYDNTIMDNLLVFIFGFVDAATMVIPGISGTAIFLLLGCYQFVLDLFSSLHTVFTGNLICYIMFGLGLGMGILIVSKIMNYVLIYLKKETYLFIVGFAVSSILILCVDLFSGRYTFIDLIFGIILFFIGYKISAVLNI